MAPAPHAFDKHEYLVCSWPLNKTGNGLRRCDALSRTLSAALLRGHTLHVWCELAMISVTPEFLEVWAPKGPRRGRVDYAEARLEELMWDLFASVTIKGASIRHLNCGGNTPKSVTEVILQDVEHALFLDFNKHSCALHVEGEAVRSSSLAHKPAGKVLVILGGVMDMSSEEEATILEVCRERGVSHHTVSLGHRQLLTSQCIKILEASAAMGLLPKALAHCSANNWVPDRGLPCPSKPHPHPPLHVVKVLDESIESFIKRPEAAALVVDMYLSSHGHGTAELSLVSVDGTLTVPKPPPKTFPILQEASAHLYLQHVAEQPTLKRRTIRIPGSDISPDACIAHGLRQVLLETPCMTYKRLSGHLLLLAEEHCMGAVAPLSLPVVPSHVSNPIAVIIAPGKFTQTICEAGKAAKKLQCGYMGSAQEVPSFVGMLFHDGLLGEILPSPQQPAAIEVASKGVEVRSEADTDIPDEVPKAAPDRTEVHSETDTDIGDEASVVARSTDSELQLCPQWIHQVVEKRIRAFAKKEAAITRLEMRQVEEQKLTKDEQQKLSEGPIVREMLSELKEFQSACDERECDAIAELLYRQIRKLSKKQKYDKASEFDMLVLKELWSVENQFKHLFGDKEQHIPY